MQKRKFVKNRALRSIFSTLTVLLLVLSLVSCSLSDLFTRETLPKDDLSDNVGDTGVSDQSSVSKYLYEWEFPTFNDQKFLAVERCVEEYYCGTMPEKRKIAETCAELFLEYFYDNIDLNDQTAVTDALLTCYMASYGDDFASYRNAAAYEDFIGDMSGGTNFVGVGIRLKPSDSGVPYIASVINGSPAEAVGLKRGDLIVSVDGTLVENAGYEDTVDLIAGPAGEPVEITVKRDGELVTLNPIRNAVPEATVIYSVIEESGYGLIEITSFKEKTFEDFKTAVDALLLMDVKGIIFDLRLNLGGMLDVVVKMIGYLVDDALPVVSYKCNGQPTVTLNSGSDGHKVDLPMVVIMDELTASAAEIFAASLRDYEKMDGVDVNVTLVGKRSFGKGVMQRVYTLVDRSAITVTVAYYNPPLGENYHTVGVLPDEGYEIDVSLTENGDAQLDRAIEAMDDLIAATASK